MPLVPNIFRIQRPRLVHVGGAFDDGAAVREHGEFVVLNLEFQQETVVAYFTHFSQVRCHLLEVELGRRAVRYLYGVAAAQTGRLRTVGAVQPLEATMLATGTIDLAQKRGNLDAALYVVPDVEIQQFAVDLVAAASQDLERLGRLQAGDDVDHGAEDAGRLAGARLTRRRGRLEDAAQARRLAGQDGHGLAVAADTAAVDPRLAQLDGDII